MYQGTMFLSNHECVEALAHEAWKNDGFHHVHVDAFSVETHDGACAGLSLELLAEPDTSLENVEWDRMPF